MFTENENLCRYREDGKTYSFNSLFISMRSQQQSRIPLRMAILNLVHELMHAFGDFNDLSCSISDNDYLTGAKHDPDAKERAECTPADVDDNGRFLMSKYSNNGRRHNHEVLSPCTKVYPLKLTSCISCSQESVMACLTSPQRMNCMKVILTLNFMMKFPQICSRPPLMDIVGMVLWRMGRNVTVEMSSSASSTGPAAIHPLEGRITDPAQQGSKYPDFKDIFLLI